MTFRDELFVGMKVRISGPCDSQVFFDEPGVIMSTGASGGSIEVAFDNRDDLHTGRSSDASVRNRYFVYFRNIYKAEKPPKKKSGFGKFVEKHSL